MGGGGSSIGSGSSGSGPGGIGPGCGGAVGSCKWRFMCEPSRLSNTGGKTRFP